MSEKHVRRIYCAQGQTFVLLKSRFQESFVWNFNEDTLLMSGYSRDIRVVSNESSRKFLNTNLALV